MVKLIFLLVIYISIASCAHLSAPRYDAIVDKYGTAANTFTSVQAAIDSVFTSKTNSLKSSNSARPYRIYIRSGDYYEKITIATPGIQLIGEDKANTRIYYDAYAGQQATDAGATQGQIWGTTGSATLIIRATDIAIHQLTIENTFNFSSNDALPDDDPKRIQHTQAVALHLDKGSDRFLARDIQLLGNQDTLFVNAGRSWFDRVLVAGNIDFIFGKGNALFTDSEIRTRKRGKLSFPHGYITAASTDVQSKFGLTFINCRLTRTASVPDNSTFLGRPWHPTTQFPDGRYADPNAIGKTIFINSWMDTHIHQEGWYSMTGTAKDGNKILFLPEDARFFEYRSNGPGAHLNSKRRQLHNGAMKNYLRDIILDGWNPDNYFQGV